MECRKWEELGLLYTSRELDEKNIREFEEHLKECDECREELCLYRAEKPRFFTAELLGETPSSSVDAEILRVCSDLKRRGTFFAVVPSFLRKAVVPVAVFAMAFVSVGYIMWNMQNAESFKSAAAKSTAPVISEPVAATAAYDVDSAADSAQAIKENFAQSRGNLGRQGVVPVDLKSK